MKMCVGTSIWYLVFDVLTEANQGDVITNPKLSVESDCHLSEYTATMDWFQHSKILFH